MPNDDLAELIEKKRAEILATGHAQWAYRAIPDFDQIALGIVERAGLVARSDSQGKARAQIDVAEQLRHIWNARGAADVKVIHSLRSLDR